MEPARGLSTKTREAYTPIRRLSTKFPAARLKGKAVAFPSASPSCRAADTGGSIKNVTGDVLKREVARELDLKAVGRALETSAGRLIVDDEEVAVRAVDVAQAHVDGGELRRRVQLY